MNYPSIYLHTYLYISIQCLCVRIDAFTVFFQHLELHVLAPDSCDPIALSSNKSQTKSSVARKDLLSLWSACA